MTISVGDILEFTARMKAFGNDDIINVFTAQVDALAGTVQDTYDDIVEYLEDIYDGLAGLMHGDISFEDISIKNVTDGIIEIILLWNTLTAGSNPGEELANGVSAYSFARTAIKKARGKKFWPPITEAGAVGNNLTSGTQAAVLTAAVDWISPFTGTNLTELTPGVLYNQTDPVISGFTPFTSVVVPAEMAYQRRRKPNVGN